MTNTLPSLLIVTGFVATPCFTACAKTPNEPIAVPGIPTVTLREHPDAGPITANDPNPCEVDVDFGEVSVGQAVVASIEITNSGNGVLDLAKIKPAPNPAFRVDYDAGGAVEPGSFYAFEATFEPSAAGEVSSWFTIQTDGFNATCPSTDELTLVLAGTGTKAD